MGRPQHTPGPWEYKWLHGHRVVKDRIDEDEAYNDLIARVSGSEANARLIAAAPEMLKECKYALEFLNDWAKANQCAHDQGYQNFKFRLERAISKAEGRDND
tara:strand:+ start:12885 stop:13190 length:306 start_codon:yes stop_codon:yes gene_type:complete